MENFGEQHRRLIGGRLVDGSNTHWKNKSGSRQGLGSKNENKMKILHKISDLQLELNSLKLNGKSIGFVPTMGALHEGHISLVEMARANNDVVVVSIFVNPIQFNNPDDLEKYPRTFETDAVLLEKASCDYIFYPSVNEMYPEEETQKYNFGPLETVMEGAFRPGHFNGVAIVVKKLFDIVQAGHAYFGKKDFQQLTIIRKLVEIENIPIEIIAGETKREKDGLAMSSRNRRLTQEERKLAPQIYSTLQWIQSNKNKRKPLELEKDALKRLSKDFKPEYFKIVDGHSLQAIEDWSDTDYPVVCVAALLGAVRLIDNLELTG